MARKLAGPGRIGSKERMKKSLKGGGIPGLRTIPSEDSLTVRFLTGTDDWHGYYEHWLKDGPKPCTTDDCEGCESDDEDERRRNFRYLANAYVVDDQKVQAIKIPKLLGEQLFNYQVKYKTLMDRDYDLSKVGSGKQGTKYMASPDAPSKMNVSRYEDQLLDLSEVLQAMLGEDVEDVDDIDEELDKEFAKQGKKRPGSKPAKSKKSPWEDDDDSDYEEDPSGVFIKKPPKSSKKKKSASVAKKKTTTAKRPVKKTVRKVRR